MNPLELLHRHMHAELWSHYQTLMRHAGLGDDALLSITGDLLRNTLRYATRHVPWYYDMREECDEAERKGATHDELLALFPVVTRSEIMENPEAFLSDERSSIPHVEMGTGGSTGEPLRFLRDTDAETRSEAALMRCFAMAGHTQGQPELWVWGEDTSLPLLKRLKRPFLRMATRRCFVNAFDVTAADARHIVNMIARHTPQLVYGYPSSLHVLAREMLRGEAQISGVQAVVTSAEKLYPEQREDIASAFSAQVFDQYGCREVSGVASECDQGNMHIFTDMAHVETLPGVGGQSRLVLTNLHNRSMPFIRYEVGDEGRLRQGRCPCGSPFPMMEIDIGRTADMFVLPSGKRVHGWFFNRRLFGIEGIARFQVVQHMPHYFSVRLVRGPGFLPEVGKKVDAALDAAAADLGEGVRVEPKYVDAIPPNRFGKHRFAICEVDQ